MKDKISIIVPIYNVPENFFKKCIDSLINQTYGNIEIILIDDGSDEKCAKMCDKFLKIDKRIIVIHQENKGLSATRNVGVNKASGKWIMFVDGDDYLEKVACDTLINITSNINDIDVIAFSMIRNSNDVQNIMKNKYLIPDKIYKTQKELEYLKKLVLTFDANFSLVGTKMIKRETLLKNEIFHDENLRQGAEGIEFNFRLFSSVKKVLYKELYLYHYVYNDASISSYPTEKNNYMVIRCFDKIRKNINDNDDEMIKQFYIRLLYVVVTSTVSSYFTQKNKMSYRTRKKKLKKFLSEPLIEETMKRFRIGTIDFKRSFVIVILKMRCFYLLYLISKIIK